VPALMNGQSFPIIIYYQKSSVVQFHSKYVTSGNMIKTLSQLVPTSSDSDMAGIRKSIGWRQSSAIIMYQVLILHRHLYEYKLLMLATYTVHARASNTELEVATTGVANATDFSH